MSAIASRGSEQEFAFTVGDGPITPRLVNSPPMANAGSNQTLEATSSAGAAVTLTGTGSDPDAGDTVSFTWMEGPTTLGTSAVITVTLAIGAHDLTLTVTDNHGASATSIAHVTVQDTTPPVLTLPENQILEATGPSGAVAVFTAAATDIVDGSMSSTCAPPAGSTFPLGVTTVRCAATDAHGNSASGVFTVTVGDTNPPVVTAPPPIAVPVTEATGARAANWPALASFLASGSAVDAVDPAPFRLAPETGGNAANSNTLFPLGSTTVVFRFRDASGNVGSAPSTVVVAYGVCVLHDPRFAKEIGSWYRIELRLCDASGRNLSARSIVLRAVSVTRSSARAPGPHADSDDANREHTSDHEDGGRRHEHEGDSDRPDFDFRYDAELAG